MRPATARGTATSNQSEAQNLRDVPSSQGTVVAQLLALAQTCLERNRPAEALECYQAAIQADPSCADAIVGLADTLASTGQPSLAVDCYLQALAIDPAHLVARVNLAALLRKNDRSEDAVTLLRPLIDAGIDHPTVGFNFANALSDLGQFDEARTHYVRVLPQHPHPAKILYNLSQTMRFRETDCEQLDGWAALASRAIRSLDDQILLHFALGKALDDLGDYDAAWRHFSAGNNLTTTGFDPDAHDREVAATIARFSQSFLRERTDWGVESERAVFIVGMPRSGTTLVEQILAAHPQVEARGERLELGGLIETRARPHGGCIPDAAASLMLLESRDLAERYLTSITGETKALRVTDKMPFNFLHLGWISMLFPRARVIHVRRDPRAVCLSCYQQHFTEELPFAYRLEHLGRYWLAYDRLMSHWRKVLPSRLYEVEYESIVSEPEEAARRLVDFCGLEWSPACLSSHERKGSVATASQWQVRQPIYLSSRARWKRYAAHLEPLLEALGNGRPLRRTAG